MYAFCGLISCASGDSLAWLVRRSPKNQRCDWHDADGTAHAPAHTPNIAWDARQAACLG